MKVIVVLLAWLSLSGIALVQAHAAPATQPLTVTAIVAAPAGAAVTATPGAPEAPAVPPDAWVEKGFMESLADGSFLAKLLALMGGVYVVLRGLAEGLTRISIYTSNTWDNKAAETLSNATWFLGSMLGKFGYGTPKPVLAEHVAQAQAAQGGTDGSKPAA